MTVKTKTYQLVEEDKRIVLEPVAPNLPKIEVDYDDTDETTLVSYASMAALLAYAFEMMDALVELDHPLAHEVEKAMGEAVKEFNHEE